MTEANPKFIRGGKNFKTQIVRQKPKQKETHKNISSKDLAKVANLNDIPDTIKENNTNVFKAQKLSSNIRKAYRHMTQLPQQLDQPDILLGLNEYKETRLQQKRFHTIKKVTNSDSIPDLPDTLEPLSENSDNQMPRPDSMFLFRKSYSEEITKSKIKNRKSLKIGENKLDDIKEKDEPEVLITEENRENENKETIENKEFENMNNEEKQKIKNEKIEKDEILDKNEEKIDDEEKKEDANNDNDINDEEKKKAMKLFEEQKKQLEE